MSDHLHPLHRAAHSGDAAAVARLLSEGVPVDLEGDEDQWTALHYAAMCDKADVVKLLLERGADANHVASFYRTPFDTAVSHGAMRAVDLLYDLASRADPDWRGTILHAAVTLGLTDLARAELAAGADPNRGDDGGATPLHKVFTDTPAPETLARILLKRRRGLEFGASELPRRRVELAGILLEAGALPLVPDRANWTSVRMAVHDGHKDVLDLFVERGTDLALESHPNDLADAAAHGGQADMIRYLAARGLVKRGSGHTPLHTAAWMAFPDCIAALLAAGVDPKARYGSGPTALDEARRRLKSTEESLEFLGFDPKYAKKYGDDRTRSLAVIALLEKAEDGG